MKRRSMIETSATLGLGALAGCALPGTAAQAPKTPFAVTDTYIPIVGSDLQFPVRRIYCIGRNYAAHAREMGSDPTREPPFFFQKPTDAIQNVAPGTVGDHPYPSLTKNYHYEVELVAALGKGGRNIPTSQALDCVYAYAIGLDMTRRDLQRAMGDEKKPWEIGKSFDRSAVIGPLHLASQHRRTSTKGAIWLKVNGVSQAERESQPDDLERRRADQQAVGSVRADGRRHHLLRHAGKRRPRGAWRRDRLPHRRPAEPGHQDRMNPRGWHLTRRSWLQHAAAAGLVPRVRGACTESSADLRRPRALQP